MIIPFLYIILKKKYLSLSIFVVATLISVKLINSVLFNIYEIPTGTGEGMMCAPMQAMSRLVKYNGDNLTDEEKKEINLFVEYDKLSDSYNPDLSDPEMVNFRSEYLNSHMFEYIKLNFKLLFKYTPYYIESLLCNTSGYWYLEDRIIINGWGVMENAIGVEPVNLIKDNKVIHIPEILINNKNHLPILGMMFSAGISLWLLLLLLSYIVYNKKYRIIITLLPLLINYLIILIGPCNRQFRYILPMYLPLAIMYCVIINYNNDKIEKNN